MSQAETDQAQPTASTEITPALEGIAAYHGLELTLDEQALTLAASRLIIVGSAIDKDIHVKFGVTPYSWGPKPHRLIVGNKKADSIDNSEEADGAKEENDESQKTISTLNIAFTPRDIRKQKDAQSLILSGVREAVNLDNKYVMRRDDGYCVRNGVLLLAGSSLGTGVATAAAVELATDDIDLAIASGIPAAFIGVTALMYIGRPLIYNLNKRSPVHEGVKNIDLSDVPQILAYNSVKSSKKQ